jgi:hypothetical protein
MPATLPTVPDDAGGVDEEPTSEAKEMVWSGWSISSCIEEELRLERLQAEVPSGWRWLRRPAVRLFKREASAGSPE